MEEAKELKKTNESTSNKTTNTSSTSSQIVKNDSTEQTKVVSSSTFKEPSSTKKEEKIPIEYKSALKKADGYSDRMHMLKQAIYDQLTSEQG